MTSRNLRIVNEKGLHARASAKFVECVEGFDASAEVSKDGMTVSGDSIMGLLMLGASRGTSIDVATQGAEAQALDASPDTYGRLLERLLASPRYGERWARHWMDAARYTDTYGYEWDVPAKGAFEYRDYLIRAVKGDVGFASW